METERLALIKTIASALRDATDGDVWHAVGLIYELADGRMEPADVRAEFEELDLPHA
ncbi:hypothetical protein ACFXKC_17935 [Streptomyces sp. NPDC059340]|uniref:hypothetical protein n=1 Tax=Streptomyces sp. NPDC059340 TaxID=3346806 RepID=UPI0036A3AA09